MAATNTFRVLISVYDKSGLDKFVGELSKLYSLKIISSGGTAKYLTEAGFSVEKVESVTDFPEILSGRVKTLHPKIHGGILADQDNPEHLQELKKLSIEVFNMVVVNLYPFEETINTKGVTLEQAIEQIDIGGVALLRAAAKNFHSVVPVCDPEDYTHVIEDLKKDDQLSPARQQKLATRVFEHTSHYDQVVSEYLSKN